MGLTLLQPFCSYLGLGVCKAPQIGPGSISKNVCGRLGGSPAFGKPPCVAADTMWDFPLLEFDSYLLKFESLWEYPATWFVVEFWLSYPIFLFLWEALGRLKTYSITVIFPEDTKKGNILLGWPKSSFQFYCTHRENLNKLLDQPKFLLCLCYNIYYINICYINLLSILLYYEFFKKLYSWT